MLLENLKHLISLSTNTNEDFVDFYIVLANGLIRSSKRILYDPKFDEFYLINEIDESFQEFSSSEIGKETNLLTAIESKCLYKS
jgi:hypothetical protein